MAQVQKPGRIACFHVWRVISFEEGLLLRAMAILVIMAHNYLHWIADTPGENEFGFSLSRMLSVIDGIRNHPLDAVRILASYFGHYGVQVFFFLSGYGLTRKYGARMVGWWAFQWRRWQGLYPAVLVSALGYFVYEGYRIGWLELWHSHMINLLLQMTGISNFIPGQAYSPIGPWWFISVILQFYLILPFIWGRVKKHGEIFLYVAVIASWLLEIIMGGWFYRQLNLNINHTILGHLDVCLMGVWFARREKVNLPWPVIWVGLAVFCGGNFYQNLWIVSGVGLLLFLLPLMRFLCAGVARRPTLSRLTKWIGELSLYLFLCNGFLRKPLIDWAKEQGCWWTSLWSCMLFILIAVTGAFLLRNLERWIFLVVRRSKE